MFAGVPALGGNWVDLIIVVILAFYFIEGLERGFWSVVAQVVSFVGSLVAALRFYPVAAKILIDNFSLPNNFANALGFLFVAIFADMIIATLMSAYVLVRLPKILWKDPWQKLAGVVPSLVNGLVFIAFFLTLFVALPIKPQIKQDITNSKIGGWLVGQTVRLEQELANIFGGALRDTLTIFTIEPQSRERVDLPVPKQQKLTLSIDQAAESQMFVLVNEERRKRGIQELVWQPQIVVVARAHSQDMWERKYFSHVDPDGKDPADRLTQGGVSYTLAGENIALAPTVKLAHEGLMNSEGHRRNILDPSFRKIGIGIIDGGIYGKMFTQNFTD